MQDRVRGKYCHTVSSIGPLTMKYFGFFATAAGLLCAHSSSAAGCLGHFELLIPGTSINTTENAVLSSSLKNISYCRVTGSVAYGHSNHSVEFELWLPTRDSYNGRFMVVGKKFTLAVSHRTNLFDENIRKRGIRRCD